MPRPPDAHAVRRLLRSVASVAETDVRPVGEGGEHSTWWVGAGHVLRLALDESGSARQRRETALRDALRPRLSVAVPASVATGEWSPGLRYTLDTRLPGVSGERRPVSAAGEEDLSRLLTALRSYPAAEAAGLALPTPAPRDPEALRDGAVRAAARLAADDPSATSVLHELRTGPPVAPADGTPVAVVHNDLKGEHLLVTGSGRVSGVLDWTDAVLGDPAEDIAGLAISVGAPAAVRVATGAGYGPAVCARGLRLSRCDTLIRLADRLYGTDDSPLPLLRAQRARAWQPVTSLDPRVGGAG